MAKKTEPFRPLSDSLYAAIMEVASTSKVVTEEDLQKIFPDKCVDLKAFRKDSLAGSIANTQAVSENSYSSSSVVSPEIVSGKELSHLSAFLELETDLIKERHQEEEKKPVSRLVLCETQPIVEERQSSVTDLTEVLITEPENSELAYRKPKIKDSIFTQSLSIESEISESEESQSEVCADVEEDEDEDEDVNEVIQARPYICPSCFNTSIRFGEDLSIYRDQINNTYYRRLQEIREHGNNDIDLRLKTYEEWTTTLRDLNKKMDDNNREFERDLVECLKTAGTRTKTTTLPTDKCTQYRNDLEKLIKVIRNAYDHDVWSLSGVCFETMARNNILSGLTRNGSASCSSDDKSEKNK
ncbi:uncharacterized protein LOC119662679 [Teleopsis dalmanni]|uniref:uncharacterized protein LOC119662679 n=1 Tax=Teleopsis dalmanni TaxID=139649 RepID=UPI0018CF87DF|nr:uncharacterized protein LOC119662679 [Teleopsis dalmanni]